MCIVDRKHIRKGEAKVTKDDLLNKYKFFWITSCAVLLVFEIVYRAFAHWELSWPTMFASFVAFC